MEQPELSPPQPARSARAIALAGWALFFPGTLLLADWLIFKGFLAHGTLAGGWSWPSVIGLQVVMVTISGYMARSLLGFLWTHVSQQGITYGAVGGSRFLPWHEVSSLELRGHRAMIRAPGHRIYLNLLWYTEPHRVISFIAQVAPAAIGRSAA